nr:hypothetical protein [Candidatus Aminicenantes bacterium]NIM82219.1 hypothetical protein [Candidatus Aminicenantes bacterium]NIN45430.1 hypothetical protein [Candidatus Aminicenantes bacterium]NIN88251.1 hypothetical protein [Candidatus Aminicenantes bacterium]NIO84608.1 hypothetical protein [Candidatus Aminicenantes bacterium]
FAVGDYDKRLELIIDPVVLVYSTYFGGSRWESAAGIAVDSSGSVYVTGYTNSIDFPTENPYQENLREDMWGFGRDVFITKLAPGGNTLVYSTFLGGSEGEAARCIAVDGSGSAYVAGHTGSKDFPMQNPFQENLQVNEWGYGQDAFVTKLSPSGNTLVYSTLLGGSDWDEIKGITVDSSGNAYVTGNTNSMDFPTQNPFQENLQATWGYGQDAFITKLSPSGSTLVYSTYLGGSYWENACSTAVDSSGNVYVAGDTESTNFPTLNPFQQNLQAVGGYGNDAFITKLSPSGDTLVYSTYLGGNDWDSVNSIVVDNKGNAYVTGITYSLDFPVNNPFQLNQGNSDAFVTKLAPPGSSLIYSTYLGGSYEEVARGIAVDSSGNAYVTGGTESVDFPTAFAFQENLKVIGQGEVYEAFITKLSPTGNTLVYSTFLGGTAGDVGSAIALDSFGNAYVTGDTFSLDFPVNNPHQQFRDIAAGGLNVFVSRIQNLLLTLQVSRQEERTWLIRKQYAEIRLTVQNPGNIPVSQYIIYRKEAGTGTDQYQAIKDIPGADIQEESRTFYDLLPQNDKSFTFKVEALDADGMVIGASEEQTI